MENALAMPELPISAAYRSKMGDLLSSVAALKAMLGVHETSSIAGRYRQLAFGGGNHSCSCCLQVTCRVTLPVTNSEHQSALEI